MQILAEGHVIMVGDLPDNIRKPNEKVNVADYDPDVTLYEVEKSHILKALHYFNGNKTRAAHSLGITIKTLYNKLHMYGEFENFSVHSKPDTSGQNGGTAAPATAVAPAIPTTLPTSI